MIKTVVSALVLGLALGATATAQTDMMDPHERGVYRSWAEHYGDLPARLKPLDRAWAVTNDHRRRNASHDHIDRVYREMCNVSVGAWNAVWELVKINKARAVKGNYDWQVPDRLQAYHEASMAIGQAVYDNRDAKSCADFSWDERMSMIGAVRKFQMEHNRLSTYYSSPGHPKYKWSNTIGLEIPGLPLKLEILEGSLKLKLAVKTRFLNIDVQSGVSRVQAKSYTGLEYFVIYTPEMQS